MRRMMFFAACLLTPSAAFADGIEELCLNDAENDQEVCDCARVALDDAFPGENVLTYEASARNLFVSATPDNPTGSWDEALQMTADETGMTVNEVTVMSNDVYLAHKLAIRACRKRAEEEAAAAGEPAPEGAQPAPEETPAQAAEPAPAPEAQAEAPAQAAEPPASEAPAEEAPKKEGDQ